MLQLQFCLVTALYNVFFVFFLVFTVTMRLSLFLLNEHDDDDPIMLYAMPRVSYKYLQVTKVPPQATCGVTATDVEIASIKMSF